FEDQVGCFGFIDNSRYSVHEAGAYGIPYRALIPQRLDNVLVAGRMLSVDLVAHNSTRNTVCCLICGQAAGTAAALAAAAGIAPRELDAQRLREALRQDGALLEATP
ncbi:MAG: FAD-dependent oxidoreductase, partial [Anaerolineae bacterium]|nr:FAD-dependent oxidoreductase [Anaerolineae bacterium]